MTNRDISDLYNKLENEYEDGGYVSRATIFNRAYQDGKVSKETVEEAREYYGTLWTYVGD